jgi:hypothetical protein
MVCKTSIAVVFMAIFFLAPATHAAAKSRLVGAGAESCKTFLRKAGPSGLSDYAANQWVMGYLTGRIAAEPNARHYSFAGPEAIMTSVVSYCRATRAMFDLDIDTAAASFFMHASRTYRH